MFKLIVFGKEILSVEIEDSVGLAVQDVETGGICRAEIVGIEETGTETTVLINACNRTIRLKIHR